MSKKTDQPLSRRFIAVCGDGEVFFALEAKDDHAAGFTAEGREISFDIAATGDGAYSVLQDGISHTVRIAREGEKVSAFYRGEIFAFTLSEGERRSKPSAGPAHSAASGEVASPMPGKVVRVMVKAGEKVVAGQGIAVVEAMKMENEFKAPRDGMVLAVNVKPGDSVESGTVLAVIG